MAQNNLVELTGNIGSDPTVHKDRKGREFLRLTIATTDSYKDGETEEWKEMPSVWHSCFAFSDAAKQYTSVYKKGMRVKVTGRLAYRQTEAIVAGESRLISEAIINIHRIEPAPLPRKTYAKNTDRVSEDSGTSVEFGTTSSADDDEIPF